MHTPRHKYICVSLYELKDVEEYILYNLYRLVGAGRIVREREEKGK